jgi:hypothetical protein
LRHQRTITMLTFIITLLSLLAAAQGIFSVQGPGPHEFTSVYGEKVLLYGRGIYQNMSAEVAPQGIAQDYVTMFLGIPLLLTSMFFSRKGLVKGRFLLAGTLGYFLVTYLFYLNMAIFNKMYLVYVALLSCSFFAFILTLLSFNPDKLKESFSNSLPVKFIGGFLVFNSVTMGLLWLSVVLPPLLKGTVPLQVEHYTTLVVQGLDLAILLPSAFVAGVLLIKKRPFGYLLAPVYFVFLSILMTALTAKVIAMKAGLPVVAIIPTFNLAAIICSGIILKNINKEKYQVNN